MTDSGARRGDGGRLARREVYAFLRAEGEITGGAGARDLGACGDVGRVGEIGVGDRVCGYDVCVYWGRGGDFGLRVGLGVWCGDL